MKTNPTEKEMEQHLANRYCDKMQWGSIEAAVRSLSRAKEDMQKVAKSVKGE